jgi:hypothetical protein
MQRSYLLSTLGLDPSSAATGPVDEQEVSELPPHVNGLATKTVRNG